MNKPSGNFIVIAEFTEDTSPGHGKGMRHIVRESYEDTNDQGKGTFCNTVEQARNRIAADKRIMSQGTDASGLINWGKMAAREYAIFPVMFGEAVE